VEDFETSTSQKRCLNRGRHFKVQVRKAEYSDAHYQMYENYIKERHYDGDMYPANEDLYERFLFSDWARTQFLEIYDDDKLIACAVFDQLFDGLSAVYCYFDTSYQRYSLGKLAILKQIEHTRQLNLPYLYLGFQIDGCKKMNYKTQFKPTEQLIDHRWRLIT
jgi:arginine-tRNA-protein transferase